MSDRELGQVLRKLLETVEQIRSQQRAQTAGEVIRQFGVMETGEEGGDNAKRYTALTAGIQDAPAAILPTSGPKRGNGASAPFRRPRRGQKAALGAFEYWTGENVEFGEPTTEAPPGSLPGEGPRPSALEPGREHPAQDPRGLAGRTQKLHDWEKQTEKIVDGLGDFQQRLKYATEELDRIRKTRPWRTYHDLTKLTKQALELGARRTPGEQQAELERASRWPGPSYRDPNQRQPLALGQFFRDLRSAVFSRDVLAKKAARESIAANPITRYFGVAGAAMAAGTFARGGDRGIVGAIRGMAGSIFGGAVAGSRLLGPGGAAAGAQVGAAMGLLNLTRALTSATFRLKLFAEETMESRRQFAQLHAGTASLFATMDYQQRVLDIRYAAQTTPSATRLGANLMYLRQEWQPYRELGGGVLNWLAGTGARGLGNVLGFVASGFGDLRRALSGDWSNIDQSMNAFFDRKNEEEGRLQEKRFLWQIFIDNALNLEPNERQWKGGAWGHQRNARAYSPPATTGLPNKEPRKIGNW